MSFSRRKFLKNSGFIGLSLTPFGVESLNIEKYFKIKDKVKIRFIVASDAHYGQPDSLFNEMIETFIEKANFFHKNSECSFCVLNGDLIHDEPNLMPLAKAKFDGLKMPFYVTKGNHDRVSDSRWSEIWNMPVNHHLNIEDTTLLLAKTSDEFGTYLSPDLVWLKEKLDENKNQKNILIFIHIPQTKWTTNAIETPAFFQLLKNYTNIKAVFHGHEHDQDGIIFHNKIPFIFDSHIGGNWGTTYKGFRVVEIQNDNSLITYMMNPTQVLNKKVL